VIIQIYLDEDSMDRDLARALMARGLDVRSVLDANMAGHPDAQQLEYATAHGRVLYSSNVRDFHKLHYDYLATRRAHSGIILVSQQRFSIGEQLRRLLNLTSSLSAEEMQNRLEFLRAWG
jgi:hypothetical protein